MIELLGNNVDWWVDGTDLHSNTLQAGQGYDPNTNTTTATMVVPPSDPYGNYMTFTNTCRDPNSPLGITAVSETGSTVTVSASSLTGVTQNQKVTISGLIGDAADYNGAIRSNKHK